LKDLKEREDNLNLPEIFDVKIKDELQSYRMGDNELYARLNPIQAKLKDAKKAIEERDDNRV